MRKLLLLGALAGAALTLSTAEAAAWGYCQVWYKCERIISGAPSYPPRVYLYYDYDRAGHRPRVYRYVDTGGYFYKPASWKRVGKVSRKARAKAVRKATKPLK
jgi:hypothetical protein